jgi:hypothetical protein
VIFDGVLDDVYGVGLEAFLQAAFSEFGRLLKIGAQHGYAPGRVALVAVLDDTSGPAFWRTCVEAAVVHCEGFTHAGRVVPLVLHEREEMLANLDDVDSALATTWREWVRTSGRADAVPLLVATRTRVGLIPMQSIDMAQTRGDA